MQGLNGLNLKPSHVVLASSLEHLVLESITAPDRDSGTVGKGAWVRNRRSLMITVPSPPMTEATANSEGLDPQSLNQDSFDARPDWRTWGELHVARTFVCSVPLLCSPNSVLQSTTEATQRGGVNPRRFAANLPS